MLPQPSRHQPDIAVSLAHHLSAGNDLVIAASWSMQRHVSNGPIGTRQISRLKTNLMEL